jgi:glutamate dehydrogenase/leucine dehydrogenase
MNVEPKDTTASVQGFGNVAQHAIEYIPSSAAK